MKNIVLQRHHRIIALAAFLIFTMLLCSCGPDSGSGGSYHVEGVIPWMSVCPSEINSMARHIDKAHGRALALGLGLGK